MSDTPTPDGKLQFRATIIVAIIGLFGTLFGTLFAFYAKTEEKVATQSAEQGKQVIKELQFSYDSLLRACGNLSVEHEGLEPGADRTLPKPECVKNGRFYGKIKFKNNLKVDLVLYRISTRGGVYGSTIKIAAGTSNESPLIYTSDSMDAPRECTFFFYTAEEDEYEKSYGRMIATVKGCRVEVQEIDPTRIFFTKRR